VDIRPLRTDGARQRVTISEAAYSRENTRKVVEELHKDTNLDYIFFNDDDIEGVREWPGHADHLHVRFKE
jgi:hypothetical protein